MVKLSPGSSLDLTAGGGPITAASQFSTMGTAAISFLVVTIAQSCPVLGYCRKNTRNDILNLTFPCGPKSVGQLLQPTGKTEKERGLKCKTGRDSQCLEERRADSERYQRKLLSTQIQNCSSGTEKLKGAHDLKKYLLLLRNTRSQGCRSLCDQGAQVPLPLG